MAKDNAKVAAGGMNLSGGENIEQIRHLLFGPQVKALENKIVKLDEKTSEALDGIRDDLNSRLDTLESFLKSELESLVKGLDSERKERGDNDEQMSREMRDCCAAQTKKDEQLEKSLETTARDLREFVLGQSKALGDEISRKHQQASDELKRTAETLRDEHVDRSVLASLFTETALRLSDGGIMDSMFGDLETTDDE